MPISKKQIKKNIKLKSLLQKHISLNSDKGVLLLDSKDISLLGIDPKKKSLAKVEDLKYLCLPFPSSKSYLLLKSSRYLSKVTVTLDENDSSKVFINKKHLSIISLSSKELKETDIPEEQEQKEDSFAPVAESISVGAVEFKEKTIEELTVEAQKVLKEQYQHTSSKTSHRGMEDKSKLFEHIDHPKKNLDVEDESIPESKSFRDIPSVSSNISEFSSEAISQEVEQLAQRVEEAPEFRNNEREALFNRPLDYSKNTVFWFSLTSSFKDTDYFWKDLKNYYTDRPKALSRKINLFSFGKKEKEEEKYPFVFSKKHTFLNNPLLRDVASKRIQEKIFDLKEEYERKVDEVKQLTQDLRHKGIILDQNEEYKQKTSEEEDIKTCLEKAQLRYEEINKRLVKADENRKDMSNLFFLDIHGQPQLISRYEEIITNKLISLNLEINDIHESQLELEKNLIDRIKKLEEAKLAKVRVQHIEQQELLDKYKDQNKLFFETLKDRKKKETLSHLGDLHESSASIQSQIIDAKNKIQYYLDNLKGIREYDDYEAALLRYREESKKFKAHRDEFNRYFSKLKRVVHQKEKKFNSFFDEVNNSLHSFQSEVSRSYENNDRLVNSCIQKWWERWNAEAVPVINRILTRHDEIIKVFSHIPAAQIPKLYRYQQKLVSEAKKRQEAWENIYSEIKEEFAILGYECLVPKPSELEGKYIDQLDVSKLRLSESTKKALFLPDANFSLSGYQNNLVGLDPKTLDDDHFIVIDQVWSTLTPEQEKALQTKLDDDEHKRKIKHAKQTMKLLKQDQFKNINKEFTTKVQSLDRNTRLFSEHEKQEKLRAIEDSHLQEWKDENLLRSTTQGEFKDSIYNISKKLFATRSVRIVNSEIVLSDTGFVEDGGTEIFTDKDYFIKAAESNFDDTSADIDLHVQETDLHQEPGDDYKSQIEDLEYTGISFDAGKDLPPKKPSVEELAQISMKKYRDYQKTYEIEVLREKLLLLNDEIEKLSEYHDKQSENLEKILTERTALFDDMQKDLLEVKEFLEGKEKELESILENVEQSLDISLSEIDKNVAKEIEKDSKSSSSFFGRWFK